MIAATVIALSLTTACGGGGGYLGKNLFAAVLLPERGAVAYANGRFVSVGKFGVGISDDGGSFELLPSTGVYSVAVAYGASGWVSPDATGLFTSDDGLVWTKSTLPIEGASGVAFGAGRYVLVGTGGAIAVSDDTTTWSAVPSPTQTDLLGVAFVGNRFLGVGRGGVAIASSDGVDWYALSLPTTVDLRGIAEGDGVIVVTGDRGTVLRSTDGATWERIETATKVYLTQATFGAGRFVVVGAKGTVLTSGDAAASFEFVPVDFGDSTRGRVDLNGVTYGAGQFVAVGQQLIVSPDGLSWVTATIRGDAPTPEPTGGAATLDVPSMLADD